MESLNHGLRGMVAGEWRTGIMVCGGWSLEDGGPEGWCVGRGWSLEDGRSVENGRPETWSVEDDRWRMEGLKHGLWEMVAGGWSLEDGRWRMVSGG
jgi:hypothetical protein